MSAMGSPRNETPTTHFTATQRAGLQVFGRLLRKFDLSGMETSGKDEIAGWLIKEMGSLVEESWKSLPVPSLRFEDFPDIDQFNRFVTRKKNAPTIVSIETVKGKIRVWYQDPPNETSAEWEPKIGDYQPRNFLDAMLVIQETIHEMRISLSFTKSGLDPHTWTRNTFTLFLERILMNTPPNQLISCEKFGDCLSQGIDLIEQMNRWIERERPEILTVETIKSSSKPAIMVWYADPIF